MRRKPATYDRIIKNIEGHKINVHCTVTRQMTAKPGYFEQFLSFWSARPEVKKIWLGLFTPQVGAAGEEILSPEDRARVLTELSQLRPAFPKLYLPDSVVRGYRQNAVVAERMHLRTHDVEFFSRPEKHDHAVPVWRQTRLHTMRLYGFGWIESCW